MVVAFSEIEQLNNRIGYEYRSLDNRELFRIVWSESIFENRYGTFREFTDGGLFIREVTETRRVRKYNYIHNRWIFEAWAPGNLTANRELPDAACGDYVPVYVFENKKGEYLPPTEKVVRFLIAAVYGKVKKDEIPSEAYLEEKEIQRAVESMDDHPSWFQTRPGEARNAIWYPGIFPEQHKTLKTKVLAEELREIEVLETKKANLEKEVEILENEVGSPMHRRKT